MTYIYMPVFIIASWVAYLEVVLLLTNDVESMLLIESYWQKQS